MIGTTGVSGTAVRGGSSDLPGLCEKKGNQSAAREINQIIIIMCGVPLLCDSINEAAVTELAEIRASSFKLQALEAGVRHGTRG